MDLGPPRSFTSADVLRPGRTPPPEHNPLDFELYAACRIGDLEHVENILQRGGAAHNAELLRRGMHHAIFKHKADLFRFLVEHGAQWNHQVKKIVRYGLLPLLEIMYEEGWRPEERLLQTAFDNMAIFPWLLDHVTEHITDVVVRMAASQGSVPTMRLLLCRGASLTSSFALHAAASAGAHRTGRIEMMDFLVESGCDVNERWDYPDLDRGSPLIYALTSGHVQGVKWLLGRGAREHMTKGQLLSHVRNRDHGRAMLPELDSLLTQFGYE